MKTLIIAEKNSVAKKIVAAICNRPASKTGYFEDENYIVTYCSGHLLGLKLPNEIDEKYNKWEFNNLPFYFDSIPLKVLNKQFSIVKDLIKRTDYNEIVNACDPDREGELIFRNIYYQTKCRCKNMTRMWITSVGSNEALREAYNTRKSGQLYDNLYLAALSRSYADYFVGLNSTEAVTIKWGGGSVLKTGRVKTPVLNIIVELEKQIQNFKPTPFYKIVAHTSEGLDGNYTNKDLDDNRFLNKDDAQKMIDKVGLGVANITDVEIKRRYDQSKLLYNLSDLQVAMNKQYGYGANTVLDVCQTLYEEGLTTYPRTSENKISQMYASKQKIIVNGLPSIFDSQKKTIKEKDYILSKRVIVPSTEIGAHEALTPVAETISDEKVSKLNNVELNIYKAIVERFLAAFYPDAVYESKKITFTRNGETFENKVENLVYAGHYEAYSRFKEREQLEFPNFSKGDNLNISSLEITEGMTNPPSRFTEGTLIKMMQNPKKYFNGSNEDKKLLEETEGLGTEATRATIIEDLKKNELIYIEKSKVYPTQKGINMIDVIPIKDLKSVDLTVSFEKELSAIAKGNSTKEHFLNGIKTLNERIIKEIKEKEGSSIVQNTQGNGKTAVCKCPACGSPIYESDKNYYCSGYKEGCKVCIFINGASRFGHPKITKQEAVQLFNHGQTAKKVKCKSKAGNDYTAFLTYSYDKNAQYPNNIFIKLDDK